MAHDSLPTKTIGTKHDHEYFNRTAVRLVMRNDANEVAIIWVKKGNYFKLPGGGMEGGESHVIAAEREAMEETGARVKVDKNCLATCEEWRNDLHQVSYCYHALLLEDTETLQMTPEEIAEGLQHQWCSFEEAIRKMERATPTTELGRLIKERDMFFLKQAGPRPKH